jgi:hypothetical protein
MVEQYPDTAIVTIVYGSTTLQNGDIIPGSTSEKTFKCRQEPAGKGGFIIAADGTQIAFSSTVYAGVNTSEVTEGARVQITNRAGETVLIGTVKRFSRGQLNCRLWV